MPQLKQDEWPKDNQPTTSEEQKPQDNEKPPPRNRTSEYPPKLPPDALPTKD